MSDTAPTTDYRAQVERLVRHLSEAEGALQALAAGEIDAVVDPATAVPILLSRAQGAIAPIGRAHVWTPVTDVSRMPSSA